MRAITILVLLGSMLAACNSAQTICIDCSDDPQFAIEVLPAHKDLAVLTPVEYSNLSVDAAGNMSAKIEAAVLLSGRVFVHTSDGDLPVSGTVFATRPSRIPGRPARVYQTKIDADQGTYVLVLPPNQDNESYKLRFLGASADQFPPQSFDPTVKENTRLDLAIDDPETLPLLYGQVQDDRGAAVFGAKVYVKSLPSGAIVSTVNYTSAGGRYQLRIPQRISTDLQIVVEPVSTSGFVPVFESPLKADLSGPEKRIYVPLQTPSLPTATTLRFRVAGANGNAVTESVQCSFQTSFSFNNSNVTATYLAQTSTDATGAGEIPLIAASRDIAQQYTVILTPSNVSGLQQSVTQTMIVNNFAPVEFALLPQRKLTGTLKDENGQPLKGVAIRPEQIASPIVMQQIPITTLSRLRDTTTDTNGRFSLLLEDGLYRIALVAPATSPLPRKILETTIDRDVDVGTVMLPAGNQIRAQLLGPSGSPVTQATISLFRLKKFNSCFTTDQCLPNAELVAEGTSDDRGASEFRLPLPDSN